MAVRVEWGGRSVVALNPVRAALAFERHLSVPAARISSVCAIGRSEVPYTPWTWLRAPGAHVPGLARLGWYGRAPTRECWAVFRQRSVVVIDVQEWDCHRLAPDVRNPDELVEQLTARLGPADGAR